ncbi:MULTISPECIES: anthranilate synthase component I [Priestia]|uniref:anthranilate synthase component I n=1 Tax=Priestia TaxID=2800373 RepID=UPI0028779B21|nr:MULTISPECIES: anthranilate synthase component I [Priestia]MBX4161792.1 anthranilate synthase component I [Priestia megaterium]MED3894434.1 anthranilate synthase component I [Priestia aryabhattai]
MTNTYTSFLEDSTKYLTIPIIKKIFIDSMTPVDLFQQVKDEAVYLLESNDESSPWSNYSFIGLNPFLYVEEENGTYLAKNKQLQPVLQGDSFKEVFCKIQQELKVKVPDLALPFKGGAVGFISYDAVSQIEKVNVHAQNDLNMPTFHFIYCQTMLAYNHQTKELMVIHYIQLDEQDKEQQKKEKYNEALTEINRYVERIAQTVKEKPMMFESEQREVSFEGVTSSYQKDKFVQDVEKIKEYIKSGDVFQAVLSQRFQIDTTVAGFDIYRVLRLVNPSPYLFYVKVKGVELIGSSPERLIQIENGHLEIHPIAGTRRRGRDAEEDARLYEDLINDEKERAEHYMLVDLARNDIGRVAQYGSVQTPVLMQQVNFSHVMHLISKVTGRLDEKVHPIDALLSAFPAGTVSGAPKVRAMQILNEIEPVARNVYAGTVAYLGFDGNIDSCIAIRTILLKDQTAYIQAGAGVVADSKPELEWKETRNKASALIKTIQLAQDIYDKKEDVYV